MRRISIAATLVCVLGFVGGCRTPSNGSKLRSEDDIKAGMTFHDQHPEKQKSLSVRMGLSLKAGTGGAEVTGCDPAHFASVIGVRPGDVVTKLNGQSVADAAAFDAAGDAFLKGGGCPGWLLTVNRGGAEKQITTVHGYDCDCFNIIGCGPLDGPR